MIFSFFGTGVNSSLSAAEGMSAPHLVWPTPGPRSSSVRGPNFSHACFVGFSFPELNGMPTRGNGVVTAAVAQTFSFRVTLNSAWRALVARRSFSLPT